MDEQELLEGRADPPLRRVRWRAAIRVIPSRYPPVDLFERIAPPNDFAALIELESLTNPRLRDERGEAPLLEAAEKVFGPGASYIMAPFAHVNPSGGRFNDGQFGAYYAARDRATAVAETSYHRARFLAATKEAPMELDMRVLEAKLDARLHDVRDQREFLPRIYDPIDYATSQRLARRLWGARSWGIAYDSVRRAGGECVAIWRPRALSECRQAEHLSYVWDGARIVEVLEKRLYRP